MNDSILEVYATTIIVKQLEVSEEIVGGAESYLQAIYTDYFSQYPERKDIENLHNVLKRDDAQSCPEIFQLAESARGEFTKLARANIKNHGMDIAPEDVNCEINGSSINYVETGQSMQTHTHYGDDAFGVVYFRDIGENEGGEIVLHDPRWQRSFWFGGTKQIKVKPKRGMFICAPNFMWHEVLTYTGQDPRMVFVLNGIVSHDSTGTTGYGDT